MTGAQNANGAAASSIRSSTSAIGRIRPPIGKRPARSLAMSAACAHRSRRRTVVRGAPGLLTGRMTDLPLARAARIPVTDTYHGVEVTEDYRWLEDASAEETIAWTKAQQQRTRAYFDGIPWRDALRARVEQLLKAESTTYKRLVSGGGAFFALKVQTPRQQPFLVALADVDDPSRPHYKRCHPGGDLAAAAFCAGD